MTNADRKILNKALAKLKRGWPKPCKEYCFGCIQCNVYRQIEQFSSLINDYLDTKEERAKWLKETKENRAKSRKKTKK